MVTYIFLQVTFSYKNGKVCNNMDLNARKPVSGLAKLQGRRLACAFAQTDQCLCSLLILESIIPRLATNEILIF